MKLVVLGSGTSVPHAGRTAAGYWLDTDGGAVWANRYRTGSGSDRVLTVNLESIISLAGKPVVRG